MNSAEFKSIIHDFPKFAEKFLIIRSKSGQLKPFVLNRAQQYAHSKLEQQLKETGKVRALILKGRQQGMCLSPDMRVLTADYKWKTLDEIQIGEKLVACDETSKGITKSGKKQSRKLRTATVENKWELYKETYEILFDNGARLNVTPEHRMLGKQRGGVEPKWQYVSDFRIGDEIRVLTRPPNYLCQTYEDGWFAGIIDGEGSCRTNGAKRISIHQVKGEVLDRMKSYFSSINMPYKEVIDKRIKCGQKNKLGDKPVHRLDIHRLPYFIELFARCRPTRFISKEWHVGHELPGKSAQDGIGAWAKVISIKPLEQQRVIDLQTSEKTFIVEGLVSHNSTKIQGRYFHKVITRPGTKAYILTHEAEATKNLFEMTQRFYDKLPNGLCAPADKASSKELYIRKYDSGYAVGTAGNKGAGRSQTIQLFHGSEVAFWPNAEDHAKGVLQAVSNEPGTEIILESTANGIGNYFYNMWKAAESKSNEYQAIFIPWYWQNEYTANDNNFRLTEDEEFIYSQYRNDGMTTKHLAWRRIKMAELSNDPDMGLEFFKQEFPCSATEAFLNPIANVFINAKYVARARRNRVDSGTRLIIGVDVALGDNDKTAIIRRKGRVAYNLETFRNLNTMEIAGMLKHVIEKEKPYKVYIDCIGVGAGVVDRLREMGYQFVEGINVARSANHKDKFRNLRAELWGELRDWLTQEMLVQIPDDDVLHGDLCNLGYKYDSSGRLQIESKDDLKARGMPSPDTADALALTFYSGFYEPSSEFAITEVPKLRPGMFI